MKDLLYFLAFVGSMFGLAILLGRFFGLGSEQDEFDELYYAPEIVEMLRKKSL